MVVWIILIRSPIFLVLEKDIKMNSKYKDLLNQAAKIARMKDDDRYFKLGAIGVRYDGTKVTAYNGATIGGKVPSAHCEARLSRKLDRGATVYLARITADGQWANSKPCVSCRSYLTAVRCRRVVYTIGPNEFGILDLA